MIKSFADKNTEHLYVRGVSRKIPSSIVPMVLRKLDYLNAATILTDLKIPPGKKLEALKRDLSGYYSIRVNDQYRIVFQFIEGHVYNVSVCDYH